MHHAHPSRVRIHAALLALTALLSASGCAGSNAMRKGTAAPDPLLEVQGEQLYREGQALAQRGDFVRSEQYLSAAIRRGYPAAKALPMLMRVCISASRLGAALQHAGPYLQLHPKDYRLRWLVASVLIGLGRFDEARIELQRVLRDAPDHAQAHYLMGVLLRDQYADDSGAAAHFAAYGRLASDSLHGAEVAAWLRERSTQASDALPATAPAPSSRPAPTAPEAAPARPIPVRVELPATEATP